MDEQQLIEQSIDREWDRYPRGRADPRLKGYGVPMWAIWVPDPQIRPCTGNLAFSLLHSSHKPVRRWSWR